MDITALGELLIDYTPAGVSERGMALFEQNPGGAPANVLVTAARLGLHTALIARVGRDGQGRFLRRTLEKEGVDLSALSEDPDCFTTLAFVQLSETGERSFSFARKPGADTRLRPEDVPAGLVEDSLVLHLGSLSMTHEPARSATLAALERAKKAGRLLSFDPNWRPLLWESEAAAKEQMLRLLGEADLVKVSAEEAPLLTGERAPLAAAMALLRRGPAFCAVTLGEAGAYLANRSGAALVPAERVRVVDSTGAGDAFWGAALAWLVQKGKTDRAALENMTGEELTALGSFACREAASCVAHRGAF